MSEVIRAAFEEVRTMLATLREWGALEQATCGEQTMALLERRVLEILREPLTLAALRDNRIPPRSTM